MCICTCAHAHARAYAQNFCAYARAYALAYAQKIVHMHKKLCICKCICTDFCAYARAYAQCICTCALAYAQCICTCVCTKKKGNGKKYQKPIKHTPPQYTLTFRYSYILRPPSPLPHSHTFLYKILPAMIKHDQKSRENPGFHPPPLPTQAEY